MANRSNLVAQHHPFKENEPEDTANVLPCSPSIGLFHIVTTCQDRNTEPRHLGCSVYDAFVSELVLTVVIYDCNVDPT